MDPKTPNPYQAPTADLSAVRAESGQMHTSAMMRALAQTQPWVRFLSILGFIAGGLTLVGGLISSTRTAAQSGAAAGLPWLAYALVALIYLVPCVHLFRYANAIDMAVSRQSTTWVEHALIQQKSFWRTVGILSLVILALYLLFVILLIAGAVTPSQLGEL